MGHPGPGLAGVVCLIVGLVFSVLTMTAYGVALKRPASPGILKLGRIFYGVTALSVLSAFGILMYLTYTRQYQYQYVWEHTSNDLHAWYRFAATWAGQE